MMVTAARETYKSVFSMNFGGRRLQLTREGAGFVFIVFGIGLAAINTGNNLLYLILAMCCSFIALSGLLSELTLKKISVEGFPPKTLYAGESYPLSLRVSNGKKRLPSYSLRLIFPHGAHSRYQMDRDLYLFTVPPGDSVEQALMITPNRRGPLRIRSCELMTSFPFGFFIKSKEIALNVKAVVFPAIRKVELPAPSQSSDEGDGTIQPWGEEVYALREFRPGDSMSMVHWKTSAKAGNLRVREFLRGGNQSYTVFLHLTDPQSDQQVEKDILEERVIETASLLFHLIRRGNEVCLKGPDYESSFGNSEAHLETLMRYLAFVGLPESKTKQ